MENGGERIPDCTSCKLIGAGGCFAGAVYAVYERSKLPSTNKNRHWLTVIGVGRSMVWPEYKDCTIYGLTNCDQGQEYVLLPRVMGYSVLMVIVEFCYQEVTLLYVILYGTLRNMRMHVRQTFSMELEMTSWAYKTAKRLLPPEHSLLGIPGPVFCQTMLLCKSSLLKLGVQML